VLPQRLVGKAIFMGVGEWSALGAALFWTLSSLLWGKVLLSAATMNLAKNLVGAVLLTAHVLVLSLWMGSLPLPGSWSSVGWLGLSSLLGIALGDTLFFRSLQILGARLALMLATTAPLFGGLLGLFVFGERLPWVGWLGMGLTLFGVAVVVADRRSRLESPGLLIGARRSGVLYGLLAAVCQAIGGAMSKQGMQDCGELEATLIRIWVALLLTGIWFYVRGTLRESSRAILQPSNLRLIIPAAAMGTWLGIWLSQVAIKQSPMAIAFTLMSTSPLFAIPIVHYYFGHRTTVLAIIGSVLAILGVYLVVSQ